MNGGGQEQFRRVRRRGLGSNESAAARQDPDDTSCASSDNVYAHMANPNAYNGTYHGGRPFDRDGFGGRRRGAQNTHRETNRSVSDRSLSGKRSRAHGRARARAMGQWLRYDVGRCGHGTRFGGCAGGDGGSGGGAANGAASLTSDRGGLLLFPPCWWRCLASFSESPRDVLVHFYCFFFFLFFAMALLYQKTFYDPSPYYCFFFFFFFDN